MGFLTSSRNFDVQYKVSIVGNSGVGKTSLLQGMTGQTFENQYLPTVGE